MFHWLMLLTAVGIILSLIMLFRYLGLKPKTEKFRRQLAKLLHWLHRDDKYMALYQMLPDVDHSTYDQSVKDSALGALGRYKDLEALIEFFDTRIAEFEKKMNYYSKADTDHNRDRLHEVAFLRKRVWDYMHEKSITELTRHQRPFQLGRREEKLKPEQLKDDGKKPEEKKNTVSGFK